MSTHDSEPELGRVLSDLRREEEASAPPFRQVLAAARLKTGAIRRRAALRLAAAAVFVAIAAIAVWWRRPAPETSLPAAAARIARWKAPTDSLLRTPGLELIRSVPSLAPQVPDYSSLTAGAPLGSRTPRMAS
jgi:hypothetical protein